MGAVGAHLCVHGGGDACAAHAAYDDGDIGGGGGGDGDEAQDEGEQTRHLMASQVIQALRRACWMANRLGQGLEAAKAAGAQAPVRPVREATLPQVQAQRGAQWMALAPGGLLALAWAWGLGQHASQHRRAQ